MQRAKSSIIGLTGDVEDGADDGGLKECPTPRIVTHTSIFLARSRAWR